MDSGNNSSSLQSSSGGDEEFDSRTFFASTGPANPTSSTAATPNINNNSHYYDTNTNNNNSNNLAFFDPLPYFDPSSPFPLLSTTTAATAAAAPSPRAPPDNPNPLAPANKTPTPAPTPRNSKKRTRASRRAPTTVLTTDTSNFRAMVQEFTGIPAPPFSSTSSSSATNPLSLLNTASISRPRFDFFNPNSASSSSSPPPFLVKPYPQKYQIPGTATGTNCFNYQLVPSSSTPSTSSSSLLNFQSLLQSQLASTQHQASVQMPVLPAALNSAASTANDYGAVSGGGGGGELGHVIGPGWGHDVGSDSAQLRQPEASRGEGMVESWICSSD